MGDRHAVGVTRDGDHPRGDGVARQRRDVGGRQCGEGARTVGPTGRPWARAAAGHASAAASTAPTTTAPRSVTVGPS